MNEIKKKLEDELNRMVERMRHMGGTATSVETIGTIGDTIQLAGTIVLASVWGCGSTTTKEGTGEYCR